MEIKKLWGGIKTKDCETCNKEDCNGRLNYESLCANINYLKEYDEKNYEKNRETFAELKKLMGSEKPAIFSFGCGIALDYIGAKEVFGDNGVYYPIDECEWAIKGTENFRNFKPELPKRTMSLKEGMMLLTMTPQDAIICFFNSLFTISENTDLKKQLLSALRTKKNFYFVCDYTMNANLHMASTEMEFIKNLLKQLEQQFSFKKLEILGGKGIIVLGMRK